MQLALFLAAATLIAVFSPVLNADADASVGSCKLPTSAEGFSAAAYAAIVVSNDPKTLHRLQLTGGEAAMLLYKVLIAVLRDHYHLCNAEMVAYSGSQGLASYGNETLSDFFNKATIAYGGVLIKNGALNCDNDVSLALRLYAYYKQNLKGRDPTSFEDQMTALVEGICEFYIYLGFDLEVGNQQTADIYSQEYVSGKPNTCNIKAAN